MRVPMTHRKTVLKNGIRIISERLDHFRSVSLGIWVNVGSRDEVEEENGISHFIEHMIFKGTRNRNSLQIAKELDAIGRLPVKNLHVSIQKFWINTFQLSQIYSPISF